MRAMSRRLLSTVSGVLLSPGVALAVNGQTDQAALVSGNNTFAFELYTRLSGTPGNLFFSPFSVSMCLGMAYAGARTLTRKCK